MTSTYYFNEEKLFSEITNRSIRQKEDIVVILAGLIKTLNCYCPKSLPETETYCALSRGASGVRRVFISRRDQIHSFVFPFSVHEIEGGLVRATYKFTELDSMISSLLLALFEDDSKRDRDFDELYWMIDEIRHDIGIKNISTDDCARIVKYLLSFEDGYLRFDSDEVNSNGLLHPVNHPDIFYSSGTFKLGLKNHITHNDMVDILDKDTNCHYLNKMS